MARDSQIQRVYRAGLAAGNTLPTHTLDEICEKVRKALNSAWFQKRWTPTPRLVKQVVIREMPVTSYCNIKMTDMKQRANAKRQPVQVELQLGPNNLTLVGAFHPVTHLIHPDPNMMHTPEFCKAYLQIVGRFMGPYDKKVLTECFRAERVKHRVYSDEARQAASARMRARDLVALRDELADDYPPQ